MVYMPFGALTSNRSILPSSELVFWPEPHGSFPEPPSPRPKYSMPSSPNSIMPPLWLVNGWPTLRISSGAESTCVPSLLVNREMIEISWLVIAGGHTGAGSPVPGVRVYDRYTSCLAGHWG